MFMCRRWARPFAHDCTGEDSLLGRMEQFMPWHRGRWQWVVLSVEYRGQAVRACKRIIRPADKLFEAVVEREIPVTFVKKTRVDNAAT